MTESNTGTWATTRQISPTERFFRLHRKFDDHGNPLGPVWFCRCGKCRFDLMGDDDAGTYYLAENPLAAYMEVFLRYDDEAVLESDLRMRKLAEVSLERPIQVLNMTARRNKGRRNITSAIWNEPGPDYPLSQKFALDIFSEALEGIWYISFKDPAKKEANLAVFSEAHGHDVDKLFEVHRDDEVPVSLAYEAADEFEIPFTRDPRGSYPRRKAAN
ncbi:RES family NAD+ phosphorylase [Streptomyces exfoliatus]|uniref:RES family NAD+ phosphorylase n=1 Tax=Streptomyces exfoliatus TaxID=1905 RepID=UPI0009983DA8|nr:RES family NAD+ phosphorylase [Streptomyces exfoliatus]